MVVFKDPAPAATSTPERKDSSSKVETAVQVPFIIFSSRNFFLLVREVHTLPLLLTRYHHASWKAAHRLKKPTPLLPKLRSITHYSWPLLMCTTIFEEMQYASIHPLNLCMTQAFMYGEEEPDLEYWKQLAEKRRYLPRAFNHTFFSSGRRWRPACWRTRSCTPA